MEMLPLVEAFPHGETFTGVETLPQDVMQSQSKPADMGRRRALLTDRERELISDEDADNQRYVAISRVRTKIQEELPQDLELLAKHHPELLEELQNTVLKEGSITEQNIEAAIENWQSRPTPDTPAATVFVAPYGEPGMAKFNLEADDGTHPAEFYLRLADQIESGLQRGDRYGGQITTKSRSTVHIEDAAQEMWADFDGLDEDESDLEDALGRLADVAEHLKDAGHDDLAQRANDLYQEAGARSIDEEDHDAE